MTGYALATHAAFALGIFVLSALLTELLVRVNIADIPNARSSHAKATPKSGGLAVAFAFMLGIVLLFTMSKEADLPAKTFAIYIALCGALVIAALVDDLKDLKPAVKLAVQVICAGVFAFQVAHFHEIAIPGFGIINLGPLGYAATMLWIVAVMNLVNFMDGINGLVSGVALIGIAALALIAIQNDAPFIYLASIVLFSATLGFFAHNFPWGRIFLGDTGSQFLGFALSTFAVIGSGAGNARLSTYLVPILILPLLFDAVLTLLLRARAGKKLAEAHRDHLYQRLTQAGLGHTRVSLLYCGLAVLCAGAAFFVQKNPPAGLLVLAGLCLGFGILSAWTFAWLSRRRVQ